MYSRLDPIFKTQFRHTETLDTRQGIRRQDQVKDKKKKSGNDESDSDDIDMWEDSTSVSIKAIKAFLEQLAGETKKSAGKPEPGENIKISQKEKSISTATPATGKQSAARAAQAYQKMHRATHTEEQQEIPQSSIPSIALRPEEIRVIHKLIEDLGTLAAQNKDHLTIRKSENFLQSLVDAVEALKAR